MTPSSIIPGDLPGLPEAWREFYGAPCPEGDLDLRIPADRCFVAYWMARVLGVPVGATVPRFFALIGSDARVHAFLLDEWPITMDEPIQLQSDNRENAQWLAMGACALWLADEIRAGRIVPPPTPGEPRADGESAPPVGSERGTSATGDGSRGEDSTGVARPGETYCTPGRVDLDGRE